MGLPKLKQSLFSRISCKSLTAFLFFIPPYFKNRKKLLKYDGLRWRKISNDSENNGKGLGMPYVICVENNTSKPIHNVELFGSNDMLTRDVFDKDGNYVSRNLKISSSIPDISYQDILKGMSFQKFKVGLTYFMTVNDKQLFQPLKIVKKMIYGDLYENILVVTKDPYQQQTNIVALKFNYEIDGLTTVVIPTMKPKTKVSYYFYPDPLAFTEVKKQNFAFRFFNRISEYFKREEIVKGISKPICIQVTNNTDEVKKDVSLFGSYNNIRKNENKVFNQHNDLITDGIVISSITPNISYAEMLYNSMCNPIKVRLNYIRVSDGNKNQIFMDLKIKTEDSSGNMAQKTIITSIDPYQQQSDIVFNKEKFSINGDTELIITELKPKTSVTFNLYPQEEEVKK